MVSASAVVPECSATIGDPVIEVRTQSGLHHDVAIGQGGQDVGEPCDGAAHDRQVRPRGTSTLEIEGVSSRPARAPAA